MTSVARLVIAAQRHANLRPASPIPHVERGGPIRKQRMRQRTVTIESILRRERAARTGGVR